MVRYYILPIYIPAFPPHWRRCSISSFLSWTSPISATPRGGPCRPLVDCCIYASHVAVEVALRSVAAFSLSSIWFSSLWFLSLWAERQPLPAEHRPMLYGMPLQFWWKGGRCVCSSIRNPDVLSLSYHDAGINIPLYKINRHSWSRLQSLFAITARALNFSVLL